MADHRRSRTRRARPGGLVRRGDGRRARAGPGYPARTGRAGRGRPRPRPRPPGSHRAWRGRAGGPPGHRRAGPAPRRSPCPGSRARPPLRARRAEVRRPPGSAPQPEPHPVALAATREYHVGQATPAPRARIARRAGRARRAARPARRLVDLGGRPAARWSPSGGVTRPACSRCPAVRAGPGRARTARRWRSSRTPRGPRNRRPPPGRCGIPPQRPHREHPGPAATGTTCPAGDRCCRRRGVRARHRRRPHGTPPRQRRRVPPPVSSRAPAPAALPDEPVGQGEGHGVGGPGAGTPTAATPRRPPSCSTARSPGATTSNTGRAPAARSTPGTGGRRGLDRRRPRPAAVEAHPVAGRQPGVGRPRPARRAASRCGRRAATPRATPSDRRRHARWPAPPSQPAPRGEGGRGAARAQWLGQPVR